MSTYSTTMGGNLSFPSSTMGQQPYTVVTTGGWGVGSTTLSNVSTLQGARGNMIDVDDLIETVKMLQERLLIISPLFEKHEKYPALKAAYDHYKLIEKMIATEV